MIGCDDVVLKCVLKTPEMIKQVSAAATSGTGTKITIESFQKRENAIFTSERSAIELDTQVKYNSLIKSNCYTSFQYLHQCAQYHYYI